MHGRRTDKYQALSELTLQGAQWRDARTAWHAFTPSADTDWDDYPALNDLMPWTAPVSKQTGTGPAPNPHGTQGTTESDSYRTRFGA